MKFLPVPPYGEATALMEEFGVLGQVLPELEACRGVAQASMYHTHDVFGHLRATVDELERILGEELSAPMTSKTNEYFDEPVGDGLTRLELMPLAALLHDIGKPRNRFG